MRYILIIIIFGSMSLSHGQGNFSLEADHIAFQVSDLDRSSKFYEEILGLEEIYNAGLGVNFKWYALNNGFQIHLIKSDETIAKYKSVHLAIKSDNMDAFIAHLTALSIPFENWNGDKNTTNTRPDGVKQIYLTDPDGYWLEINDNE